MTGFGASFTDSSAWLVANSPLRSQIMTKLFDPVNGIGLDFLRQPVGASDFSRSVFSYDDMPAGQTDSEHVFNLLMCRFDPADVVGSLRRSEERSCRERV